MYSKVMTECPLSKTTEDGQLDMNAADEVAITGLDEYHSATSLDRLTYPKP